MKKRKLTKKEWKAQRNAERAARGVPPGWARSEMTFAESEAAFWRNEFGVDVDEIGPALVEKVIARDREWRAKDLERSVERWPGFGFWECSECGYLDTWPRDLDRQPTTCMGCGAAMNADRAGGAEADWIEHGPVLARIDDAESERVLAALLDRWIEDHVRDVRLHADPEFDLAWGPGEVLEEVQAGALDGVIDDLRVVDWRVVARGVAAWLDEHPEGGRPPSTSSRSPPPCSTMPEPVARQSFAAISRPSSSQLAPRYVRHRTDRIRPDSEKPAPALG